MLIPGSPIPIGWTSGWLLTSRIAWQFTTSRDTTPCEMFLGAGGKRRVLWRLFQKMLHVRSPFDVISTDASLIRGSHGRMPSRADDYPVLLTSWPLDVASQIAMTDVKEIMLKRLVAGQS